jgi:hypothetical protein
MTAIPDKTDSLLVTSPHGRALRITIAALISVGAGLGSLAAGLSFLAATAIGAAAASAVVILASSLRHH